MHTVLDTPVQYLKGIGPKRAKAFARAGINTVEDLLYYFPRRYVDRTQFSQIADLKEGDTQTIRAKVLSRSFRQSFYRRPFSVMEITVGDESGKINCVWFNQPYLKEYFPVGEELVLYGKVERYLDRLQMSVPEFEIVASDEPESLSIGRIVPVYTLPEGITQRTLRQLIKQVLDEQLPRIHDALPYGIRTRHNLLNLAKSILNIHFPEDLELQKQAYTRLAFEEFFIFQLPLILRKLQKKEKRGIAHRVEGDLIDNFLSGLSFKLTAAQAKVLLEIKSDMVKPQPMQRLLQGDVGSGKTVVAMAAAMMAIQGGYQAAFMAPTEILAKQHYGKISSELGVGSSEQGRIKIGLLTSGLNKKEKDKIYQESKDGKIDLVIGTHALLEENVGFKNLGLVVIDEQHKFGVGQRALLPKKGLSPDILIMTATPIPRTLAITLYGDLDISVINELPPGRLPIETLHFAQGNKKAAYAIARDNLKQGGQVYII